MLLHWKLRRELGLAVFEFHRDDDGAEDKGNAIGKDNGPFHDHDTVDQPKKYAAEKYAERRQR